MDRLHFLTAGIPLSTPAPRNTVQGLKRVHSLKLDGMELEYVRGVHYNPLNLNEIQVTARSLDLVLSAHAPYYINLNAQEKPKIEKSFQYILDTARLLDQVQGYSIVFHAGYYLKMEPSDVYRIIRDRVKSLAAQARKESLKVWIRPESMGKPFQFGTLQELIRLTQEIGHPVMPCLDLSHIHALTQVNNSYEEWENILKSMEKELGAESLSEMHIHYSGIQYGRQGEIRHLILRKSDARYRELLTVLKDYDCKGILVCESPNVEGDCLMLKKLWNGDIK